MSDRQTLWSAGLKGSRDWMRVLVNRRDDRVEVKFKDALQRTRRKLFPNDRQGRADAVQWAKTVHAERQRLGRAHTTVTHADLWAAYTESRGGRGLRQRSRPSYLDRWRQWQTFIGAHTRPEDTTPRAIDQFVQRASATPTRRGQPRSVNQIRQVLNIARTVYAWGHYQHLLTENPFAGYRWEGAKDAPVTEPAEYAPDEFPRLLAHVSPQSSRRWRAHVALIIAGHHGQRANAVLHLAWEDPVDGPLLQHGAIVWPRRFQKNGRPLVQPLTWDLVAAIATARYWRQQAGYTGPWILFGGSAASRGTVRVLREWETDPKHKRVGRTGRRAVADRPYSYGALWQQLRNAEDAAGIPHRAYRAVHGLRKHAAGNVADRTGDARLAMEWIGDDIKQAPAYLKTRSERMQRAADAAASSVPQLSAEEEGE